MDAAAAAAATSCSSAEICEININEDGNERGEGRRMREVGVGENTMLA